MREFVHGFTLGVANAAEVEGTKEELVAQFGAMIDAIVQSTSVTEVLSDAALSKDSKAALAQSLFMSRVSKPAMELVQAVIAQEHPRFFFNTLEEVRVLLNQGEVDLAPGFEGTRRRIEGYVAARLGLCNNAEIDSFEREVLTILASVEESTALKRFLSGMNSTPSQRGGLIDEIFHDRLSPMTLTVVRYAASLARVRDFSELLTRIANLASDERGRRIAEVRSAYELGEEDLARLGQVLEQVVGHTLDLRPHRDPSLIAGVFAVIGDKVFDGSARHRLDEARAQLSLAATR